MPNCTENETLKKLTDLITKSNFGKSDSCYELNPLKRRQNEKATLPQFVLLITYADSLTTHQQQFVYCLTFIYGCSEKIHTLEMFTGCNSSQEMRNWFGQTKRKNFKKWRKFNQIRSTPFLLHHTLGMLEIKSSVSGRSRWSELPEHFIELYILSRVTPGYT